MDFTEQTNEIKYKNKLLIKTKLEIEQTKKREGRIKFEFEFFFSLILFMCDIQILMVKKCILFFKEFFLLNKTLYGRT